MTLRRLANLSAVPHNTPSQRIALVRHGETDWNARRVFQGRVDRPLNEDGERQADAAGAFTSGWTWERLIVSPLTRAQQTAALVNAHVGIESAEVVDGFTERDFGEAEGVDRDEATARWGHDGIPGAETMAEVIDRTSQAWATLVEDGSDAVVVSHVVINRAIVELVTGTDPGFLANGSVLVLERTGDRWALVEQFAPAPASTALAS